MKKTIVAWSALLLSGLLAQFAAAQSWTANGPLPRRGHSAVFDPATRQMIVFGGDSSRNYTRLYGSSEVWRLLPSASLAGVQNWVGVNPKNDPPAARWGHFGGYDPGTNRMIVFGGETQNVGDYVFLNDVWVLANANGKGGTPAWSELVPTGEPPYPRNFAASAYDPASNTLMIYGGQTTGTNLADYWVLSHANGGERRRGLFFPLWAGGPDRGAANRRFMTLPRMS